MAKRFSEEIAKAAPEAEKAKADPAGDKETVERKKRIDELQRKIDELNAKLSPIQEEIQLQAQLEQLEHQFENAKARLAPATEEKAGIQRPVRGGRGGGMGGPGGMGGGMGSGGMGGMGGGMGGGGMGGMMGGMGGGGMGGGAGKGQARKTSVVTLENQSCILVQKPNSDKISAYSVTGGDWSSYTVPKEVKLTPVMSTNLIMFYAKGDEVRQLVAYIPQASKWITIDLKEPAREAVPVVAESVGAIAVGRRVYAVSAMASKWDVTELEEGAKPIPVVWPNRVTVDSKDDLYVFSGETGKWSHYDEANPAVVTPSGKVVTPPKD